MKRFNLYQLKTDLRRTFLLSLVLSLTVFAWLRMIFFDIPFSFPDEGLGLFQTIATFWLIIFLVKISLNFLLGVRELIQKAGPVRWSPARSGIAVIVVISLSVMLFSCNVPPTGIRKNFTTGMVTKYSGMVPAETSMIMNGEELNHNEIPLGEKFTIINKNIDGLVVKNDKVSVGCSLTINDTKGRQIFKVDDLFLDNGVFAPDSAKDLRCQVNTGKPMEWENVYAVTVVFWDKFGKGKIENSLNIATNDVP